MDLAFLLVEWLGKPVWMWLSFLSIVVALLAFDLGVLHRDQHEIEVMQREFGQQLIHLALMAKQTQRGCRQNRLQQCMRRELRDAVG